MNSMPRCLVGALALLVLATLPTASVAQTGPGETRPDLPAKVVKSAPVNLVFDRQSGAYDLSYSMVPRQQVFGRVFTEAGVSLEWRDRSAAIEIISGKHRGSLDAIASELLAGRNFVATYQPINAIPRMSHLAVLGRSGGDGRAVEVGVGSATPPGQGAPTAQPDKPEAAAPQGACTAAASRPEGKPEPFISAAVSPSADGTALRDRGQILLDSNTILLAGGVDDCSGRPSDAAELLDQATGKITPTGRMRTARSGFSMQKLPSGDVLAIGGDTGSGMAGATEKVELYEVATGQWKAAGLLSMRKSGIVTCGLKDGSVLIVGGQSGPGKSELARQAEIFDPAAQRAQPVAAKATFAHGTGAKALPLGDGRCLIASDGPGANLEIFDAGTRAFAPVDVPEDVRKSLPGAVQLGLLPDATVLLVSERSYVFNPKTGNFRSIP